MNKLLVALFAGAFAFFSAGALADDSSLMPLSKMDTQQAKQARADAKAKWATMTPQEQAAAKKAAAAKKQADQTALDRVAQESNKYDTKMGAQEAAESKAVPKPTKEQRKEDVSKSTKPTTGQ